MTDPQTGTYTLTQAAETLGVSEADLQAYLQEDLVAEERGPSGDLAFSRAQMRRLWSIVTLHRDLGINLPGVAAILQLREQFEAMRRDLALLVEIVERELGPDAWDRLWPHDRPRPETHVSVEEVSDLPGEAGPDEGPAPTADAEEHAP
jgi:DNA-binding transcriptional MerR regulator